MKMKILNLRKKNPKKTDLVNVYQIEVVPKRNEMISLLKARGNHDIDPKLLQQATFRGKVFIKHVRLCKSKILTLRYSVLILGCLLQ